MTQKFVIVKPRPGRSTVAFVTHVYDARRQRTRTVYLGSCSIHLDPESIPATTLSEGASAHGISLRPTAAAGTAPFEMTADDVQRIRDWLRRHGTHVQRVAEEEARQRALESGRLEQERQLRARIEAEIRPGIEAAARAEVERIKQTQAAVDPLDAAVKALDAAALSLQETTRACVARGVKLAQLRSTRTRVDSTATALDRVQAKCNVVRIEAMERFEEACKAAGLMGRRGRAR